MNIQVTQDGVRPFFVVVLGCAIALVVIPIVIQASKPSTAAPAVAAVAEPAPVAVQEAPAPVVVASRPPAIAPRPAQPLRMTIPREIKAPKPVAMQPLTEPTTPEQRWGIQVCSARLIMGNSFVNLQYKIVDPDKATLFSGNRQAYILEPNSGAKLYLPTRPKEGSFPPPANRLSPGRTLFAVIGNKGGILKSGSKVSVVLGDAVPTDLTIE
jgi:hypothetical protein